MRDMLLSALASRKATNVAASLLATGIAHFGFQADANEIAAGLMLMGSLLVGQGIADLGGHKPYDVPDTWSGAFAHMLRNLFTSKKHMAAVTGYIVSGAAHYGLDLEPEVVLSIMGVFSTYIITQGAADGGRGMRATARRSDEVAQALVREEEPEEPAGAVPIRRKPKLRGV